MRACNLVCVWSCVHVRQHCPQTSSLVVLIWSVVCAGSSLWLLGDSANSRHWFTTSFPEAGAGKRCSESDSEHRFTTSFLWRRVPESDARSVRPVLCQCFFVEGAGLQILVARAGLQIFVATAGLQIFVEGAGLQIFVARAGLQIFVEGAGLQILVARAGLQIFVEGAGLQIFVQGAGLQILV